MIFAAIAILGPQIEIVGSASAGQFDRRRIAGVQIDAFIGAHDGNTGTATHFSAPAPDRQMRMLIAIAHIETITTGLNQRHFAGRRFDLKAIVTVEGADAYAERAGRQRQAHRTIIDSDNLQRGALAEAQCCGTDVHLGTRPGFDP